MRGELVLNQNSGFGRTLGCSAWLDKPQQSPKIPTDLERESWVMQSIIAPKVANAYSKIDFILKKKMRAEADLFAILQFSFQIREMVFCYQNCSLNNCEKKLF